MRRPRYQLNTGLEWSFGEKYSVVCCSEAVRTTTDLPGLSTYWKSYTSMQNWRQKYFTFAVLTALFSNGVVWSRHRCGPRKTLFSWLHSSLFFVESSFFFEFWRDHNSLFTLFFCAETNFSTVETHSNKKTLQRNVLFCFPFCFPSCLIRLVFTSFSLHNYGSQQTFRVSTFWTSSCIPLRFLFFVKRLKYLSNGNSLAWDWNENLLSMDRQSLNAYDTFWKTLLPP